MDETFVNNLIGFTGLFIAVFALVWLFYATAVQDTKHWLFPKIKKPTRNLLFFIQRLCIKYSPRIFFRYIKNCWKFKTELASYYNFDSYSINQMASAMYKDIALHIRKHGHVVGSEKIARRGLIISELLVNLDPEITEYHGKLLDTWWNTKDETELLDGSVLIDFKPPPGLERKLDKERLKLDARAADKRKLLIKYITKYHEKLWD